MIAVEAAKRLIDFGARNISDQRAREQLEGAVAIHDMLSRHRVAYLADEVGMGKTYVALGALALFRHYQPDFRALIIAPRENIQDKWQQELRRFVRYNVCFNDLRVRSLDERPARSLVKCTNLIHLVHEVSDAPNRDFFLRMPSFSLPLASDSEKWSGKVDELKECLPWIDRRPKALDRRSKKLFKDNFARAVCCALPEFDLVIIDEAHNLKHGFSDNVSARNRVMGLAFGRDPEVDRRLFPGYGPRAKRVLMLSATPIEDSYRHLYNQLDVFGLAERFEDLRSEDPDVCKRCAARFLIRRVTRISACGREYTKNQYRREWRRGGVQKHDEPINLTDDRQRLAVALVQKKVSELLGHERFNSRFQIGMLASFESFLETAKVKRDQEENSNFDDAAQTDQAAEREGIDVQEVNRLAQSYRRRFAAELPHPKMDALVASLADSWLTGRKSLVFVRRIASVKEIRRKLDDCYDKWLIAHLRKELPAATRGRLEKVIASYGKQKLKARDENADLAGAPLELRSVAREARHRDTGGSDTFFAWFFRGEGPKNVLSGANIQGRFIKRGTVYSTFFSDNHAMAMLDARPGGVLAALAKKLDIDAEALRTRLNCIAAKYIKRGGKITRSERFMAGQAAAFELLADQDGPLQERARTVYRERFQAELRRPHSQKTPDVTRWLEEPTFLTELRERPALRSRIWPESSQKRFRDRFREEALRAKFLAGAARLGHAFVDLYVLTIQQHGTLSQSTPGVKAQESEPSEEPSSRRFIDAYLDLLEKQMRSQGHERRWCAFDELEAIAEHFGLILDVNLPDAVERELNEISRPLGILLGSQQPVGGMSGSVNHTLVRQFRMPGYPLVLVTTDLLQEGEDLHTFCSEVHHYGLSWTPSAMEQRIGRIDRVNSQTERRLTKLDRPPVGDDKLQVYYPYLEDTVEILQVGRVLERMDDFLRLMHEGLVSTEAAQRSVDVATGMVAERQMPRQPEGKLESAFPVPPASLHGEIDQLRVSEQFAQEALARFHRIRTLQFDGFPIDWEKTPVNGKLLGTVKLAHRQQPIALLLSSFGERLLVRCVSPVGRVEPSDESEELYESGARLPARIGVILAREDRSYDLTVEDDVLLANKIHDHARVGSLIRRVAQHADVLEQEHLPGHDEPLTTFRRDLVQERTDER